MKRQTEHQVVVIQHDEIGVVWGFEGGPLAKIEAEWLFSRQRGHRTSRRLMPPKAFLMSFPGLGSWDASGETTQTNHQSVCWLVSSSRFLRFNSGGVHVP